ncbi:MULTISPECIES: phage N-6-adenine-methyltransferase [unclassified Shewanella]|uniref:phage N-6-adenine-methyltransferase n=1 Tax=unclassified Shewanella TaxID=196818 RepID=UPI0021DAA976|nr:MULTISPECIES: phage N-6-adenine-methyltransferase [unclassified Shewanella]MCU8034409.1 phage N-6-adenine-methyltransferase [Shewanella sp. SM71]MCU8096116.1 phage N-6-adenine-methyltransferase [Shewanella sp. SM102]
MSTKDSYRTPPAVFKYYHRQYRFKLDAAASDNNHLHRNYITEEQNTHESDWFSAAFAIKGKALHINDRKGFTGNYAWMNPPYSDIGPFVETAIKWQEQGFGCVMLVMMDQSVGWYKRAVQHCQEVHLVIGGRLSFIDPVTGKPANGNNKGSMFLVFQPFGKPCMPIYKHVERDQLLKGAEGDIPTEIESRDIPSTVESAQLDIEEQIARDSTATNSLWPIEVLDIAKEVFALCGIEKPTEIQFQEICEEANRQRLEGYPTDLIIDDLVMNMPTETKSCAA